jgi:hypothetical protein
MDAFEGVGVDVWGVGVDVCVGRGVDVDGCETPPASPRTRELANCSPRAPPVDGCVRALVGFGSACQNF